MTASLLDQALARIGHQPIFIKADSAAVDIRWRRAYDGIISDERQIISTSIDNGLQAIVAYEDEADAWDAKHSTEVG